MAPPLPDPGPRPSTELGAPRPASHSSLIALLDDPSPGTWEPVFRILRQRTRAALPELQRAQEDPSPRLRARARALIASHERRGRLRRVVRYAARTLERGERFDLERALWMFSSIEGERFDARPFERSLDLLAEDAMLHFAGRKVGSGKLERAMALPDYMGRRFRFVMPRDSKGQKLEEAAHDRATHHPHNILLHRVLQRRSGLPLSIAIVWRLVAERIGAPLEVIGIPGHVLVRVPGAATGGGRRILVDPASEGRPVSRREVREYLEAYDVPFGPATFAPLSPRGIMRRYVANYMRGLGLRGQLGQAEELLTLHALLDE